MRAQILTALPLHVLPLNVLPMAGLLVLSLAACQPKGLTLVEVPPTAGAGAEAAQLAAGGCDARVEKPWVVGAATHTVEASTTGPSCAQAVVTLAVRGADGTPELAWSSPTQDIFGLYDAADAEAMKTALADWIDQSHSMFATASALPAWTDGKEAPGAPNEEFPFHAETWFDRQAWEQMRKDNAPVFAFPQGRESQAVFILRDGRLEPIGVQQFPG
ncbi:MAG: hypothetical protein Q8R02_13330 [Hyphomonadaceae bacterium]|nr:hypothetical protein [Hyphomonadaceae bacterium]